MKYLGKFIYKRSSIAKGIVKNIGKESNLLGERADRKEKEPCFTNIQGLSFTSQMVNALGNKNDLCITVEAWKEIICSTYYMEHYLYQSQKTILIWDPSLMR